MLSLSLDCGSRTAKTLFFFADWNLPGSVSRIKYESLDGVLSAGCEGQQEQHPKHGIQEAGKGHPLRFRGDPHHSALLRVKNVIHLILEGEAAMENLTCRDLSPPLPTHLHLAQGSLG